MGTCTILLKLVQAILLLAIRTHNQKVDGPWTMEREPDVELDEAERPKIWTLNISNRMFNFSTLDWNPLNKSAVVMLTTRLCYDFLMLVTVSIKLIGHRHLKVVVNTFPSSVTNIDVTNRSLLTAHYSRFGKKLQIKGRNCILERC